MEIRTERPGDAASIHAITQSAFDGAPHAGGNEARIVDALRAAGALTLSLVTTRAGELIGHIAFSPVSITGSGGKTFGLGPVSVRPDCQRKGIGSAMIMDGLDRLRSGGADVCVLLGDPEYYGRFGFVSDPQLTYCGFSTPHLQRIVLNGAPPKGDVHYHPAFNAE